MTILHVARAQKKKRVRNISLQNRVYNISSRTLMIFFQVYLDTVGTLFDFIIEY